MIDPFRETDPRWCYGNTSVEQELVPNVRDYLKSQNLVAREKPLRPTLPHGVTLNQFDDGRWCLVFPDGVSGFRSIIGTRDELLDVASRLTTTLRN